jgi:hypothetical protein
LKAVHKKCYEWFHTNCRDCIPKFSKTTSSNDITVDVPVTIYNSYHWIPQKNLEYTYLNLIRQRTLLFVIASLKNLFPLWFVFLICIPHKKRSNWYLKRIVSTVEFRSAHDLFVGNIIATQGINIVINNRIVLLL